MASYRYISTAAGGVHPTFPNINVNPKETLFSQLFFDISIGDTAYYGSPGATHCCGAGTILANHINPEGFLLEAIIGTMKQGVFFLHTPAQSPMYPYVPDVVKAFNKRFDGVANIKYEEVNGVKEGILTVEVTGDSFKFYEMCEKFSGIVLK
jgi:hypothetical protein